MLSFLGVIKGRLCEKLCDEGIYFSLTQPSKKLSLDTHCDRKGGAPTEMLCIPLSDRKSDGRHFTIRRPVSDLVDMYSSNFVIAIDADSKLIQSPNHCQLPNKYHPCINNYRICIQRGRQGQHR